MKTARIFSLVMVGVLVAAIFGTTTPTVNAASLSDETISMSTFAEGDVAVMPEMPFLFSVELPGLSLAAKKDYACSLLSQSPKDWTKMKPRQDFDMRWTVLNTGAKTWTTHGTDYKYIGGTAMHTRGSVFDMPKSVAANGKVALYVDMNAPKSRGTYVTYWGLANGSGYFCRFYFIVTVK